MRSFKVLSVIGLLAQVICSLGFYNPVRKGAADPAMVWADGNYHLTYTSDTHIQITKSPTIGGLNKGETKTVWTDSDTTRNLHIWAPEMHRINGIWIIFYSSRGAKDEEGFRTRFLRGCNGPNPSDCTYTFGGDLVAPEGQRGGPSKNNAHSIDGSYLKIPGKGEYHVLSMIDEKGLESIGIATLDTSKWKVGGWNVICRPDQPWEQFDGDGAGSKALRTGKGLVEGPYALYHGKDIWLSYSGSDCSAPQYALGLLHYNGGDPLKASSWEKTWPVLSSANGHYGTGHNSFFSSPDGTEIWNLFHATSNPKGHCGVNRYTMAQKVTFDAQNNPIFGEPLSNETEIPPPSGQGKKVDNSTELV
ncbi:hypothetical protein V2G26_012168 [Clonostachys chloroleuca]